MTKSICVYCGSRDGSDPAFADAAEALGRGIADRGWRLVYGAGDVGLMGRVARTVQAAGAETFGVIPTHLLQAEVGKQDLTRFVVTETMHERKKVMFMNADAVIVLPGGAGTLDEFFEVLTWRQLGLHGKPIVIANVADYWTPLIALLEATVTGGFAERTLLDYVRSAPDTEAALKLLD
ncbi:TIGR00730 family Rossman fold protein [Jannaschia sp. S6380]|uniref:LOG family protein n=1 Tax=Jannaschia sp. S6380 TaxID=2926408 RepID=UPI001FF0F10A|nr:TIGR00730 family Rossman fold protein [Jannaschia sp. S6380]MCK0166610.1 TIGR00730 family Rossman fold protein [Jannaschia sp. S6380]